MWLSNVAEIVDGEPLGEGSGEYLILGELARCKPLVGEIVSGLDRVVSPVEL
jgi:hypothetical protein